MPVLYDDETETAVTRTLETVGPERSGKRAQLVQLVGEDAGRVYTIGEELYIGRGSDVMVKVVANDVSRKHARIALMEDGSFVVEDLGSRNGTRVNGVPVTTRILQYGDKIQIGASIVLVFTRFDMLDEQLLQMQKMDSIGKLSSSMAHDFGNLLAAIMGNLEFLQAHCGEHYGADGELIECLDEMRQAVQHGTEFTRRLLGFARRDTSDTNTVDVGAVVREVADLIRRSFNNSTIEVDVAEDCRIFGNQERLHQVLMNLCMNAKDAMPEGGRLTLRGRRMQLDLEQAISVPLLSPGVYVVLEVEDTGIGMDEATRRRVFEPFFTTKGPGKGTGLGLATVYGIVRSHGGQVHVDSERERGTTFRLFFPAQNTATEGQPTRRIELPPGLL